MEMCLHGNQVLWEINHSFISLYCKYQFPNLVFLPIIIAPVISSEDKIYCTRIIRISSGLMKLQHFKRNAMPQISTNPPSDLGDSGDVAGPWGSFNFNRNYGLFKNLFVNRRLMNECLLYLVDRLNRGATSCWRYGWSTSSVFLNRRKILLCSHQVGNAATFPSKQWLSMNTNYEISRDL